MELLASGLTHSEEDVNLIISIGVIRNQLMYIVYILRSSSYGSVNSPVGSPRPSIAVTRGRETA